MRYLSLWLFMAVLVAFAIAKDATAVSWDGGNATFVWGDNGNWNPDGSPAGQPVLIGDLVAAANDTTLLDAAYIIDSLTITNGADVENSTDNGATNDFALLVNGNTTVSNAGSSIVIFGGDPNGLDTDNLTINSGASVILDSTTAQGTAVVELDGSTGTGLLSVNTGGTLTGTGRIDLEAAPVAATTLILNSGTIVASTPGFIIFGPPAGTLQITATSANARFDWDGGGAGILQANGNQTLDIDVAPGAGAGADPFSGTMNLSTGSTIDISTAWALDTGTINANTPDFGLIIIGQDPDPGAAAHIAGAAWTMTGGTINIDDTWDSLQLDSALTASGGTINNNGKMIFNAAATIGAGVDFQMIGTLAGITVNAGHLVTINDANFDLDGGNAVTNVTTIGLGATLDVNHNDVGADDNIQHTINLNGGTLNVTNAADALPWVLNTTATVNAAGGATSVIAGDAVNIIADINVTGNSTLQISADSEFFAATTVVVEAGSTFNVNNTPIYNGGSYEGAGLLRPGAATIATATIWNVDTVKLDDGTVTANANLTINTNAIDTVVGDGYDGSITIADAALLTVNIAGVGAWTVDPAGDINYSGNAGENTFLAGSEINLNGILNVTGDGRADAELNIGSTGFVNILTAGEPLRLSAGNTTDNTNTIAGGTINGPGILGADAGTALHGSGTINAAIDFDAASNLKADGGILSIVPVGAIVDVNELGTNDADGILEILNPWNSNATATVVLNGGELRGAAVTNDGAAGVNGHGLISADVINNTHIDAEGGGTLTLQGQPPDILDGAGAEALNAISGNLTVVYLSNTAVAFSGTVRVDAGQEFFGDLTLWTFAAGSTLDLNGGTFRSNRSTVINGTVDVAAGPDSTISNPNLARFASTSSTTLTGNLRLVGLPEIQGRATFSGGGSLINTAGSTLTLIDGADVDVLLENQGTLVLGALAAQTTGLDFEQTATGAWNVQLGGTGINDFDRMTLTGLAAVDGTLNLSLIGGYVPALADPLLTILTASSVSGTFDVVNQPATMPPTLMFDVIYNAGNIQLDVVALLTGDYNRNGAVDAADYPMWRDTLGAVVTPFSGADGDGDGMIDDGDYTVWRSNFGNVAGSGSAVGQTVAVPEPAAALLALWTVAGYLVLGSRGVKHTS